jgi:hypothetical protein
MCGDSKKIVNVILNSNNRISGSNNAAEFFIDWSSILERDKKYQLHWTYVGQPNTFTIDASLALVYVDFQMENYLNRTSNYGAPSTQCIGSLRSFYLNGSINYLVSYPTNTGSINSNYSLNNYLIYNVGLQSLFLPIITGNFVPFKHVPSSISYTNITMGATFTGSLTSSSVLPDGNNNISRIIISGGGSLQNYNDTLSFNYQCR